jgi:hypothetical protein
MRIVEESLIFHCLISPSCCRLCICLSLFSKLLNSLLENPMILLQIPTLQFGASASRG